MFSHLKPQWKKMQKIINQLCLKIVCFIKNGVFISLLVSGTHVSSHCTQPKGYQCKQCPGGYYTENDNYIDNCLPCRSCNSSKFHHQIPAYTDVPHENTNIFY